MEKCKLDHNKHPNINFLNLLKNTVDLKTEDTIEL